MGKRRASGDDGSDVDISDILTSTKRPRVQDEDEDHVREDETEEDKEFEATYGDKVRASIEAKQIFKGRIAELGIIQSLEMQQFMCHSRLSFVFGPQINFIIGHNGSGKSAVLSALTVALGGKAITTGRGSGLKSFIQEGKTWSDVTVTIKNEGPEAYRPDVYGKSIIINRSFTRSGSSGYKIKSKDGKTVSTKKEELASILDHMNIQVDNPINILTQDTSRQFLAGTGPNDKYELFLRGTQLKQLSEEYENTLEEIGKTYKILEAKKQVLPDLDRAVAEAKNRLKVAQRAVETRGKVQELKQEQAWAHVAGKEAEMTKKIEDVAKRTRKLSQLQGKVDAATKDRARCSEVVVALENEINDLGDIDDLINRRTEIGDQMRANKTKIRGYQTGEKDMTVELNTAKNTMEDLQKRIDIETKKLQEDKKAEQEERQRKMEAARTSIIEHESRRNEINAELRRIEEGMEPLKKKLSESDTTFRDSKSSMEACTRNLYELDQRARAHAFDRLAVFGSNLPQVLKAIEKQTWQGKKPIGPLGAFITLPTKEKKWADILRATLGNLMTSFAVTHPGDRATLRRLLVDFKNPHMQVVVAADELFEYESGEPPVGTHTVLRALQFNDGKDGEYVKRIFINGSRIENTLLAATRAEAQRLAEKARENTGRGSTAVSADLYKVIVYPDGGSYSQPIQELKISDRRARFFAYEDPEAERQHWRRINQEAKDKMDQAQAEVNKLKEELGRLSRQRDTYGNEVRTLENQLFIQRQTLRNIQNEHNDDMPVNIASLEEAMKEAEETRENILVQFRDLVAAKGEVEHQQKPLLEEMNKIKAQIDAFEAKRSDLKDKMIDAVGKRSRAEAEIESNEGKLKKEQADIEDLEKAAKLLQEEYENWTRQAEDYCNGKRLTPRKMNVVERELASVEAALKRQEQENGATVEELEEALFEAQQKYTSTTQDLKHLARLNKALKNSIVMRLSRWHDFRRHIALRTKLLFQHHLSMRAYFGKVLFDHERQKLDLKVQTDDQAATQGLNKDPKSLSGGEKSFATICLLLALWEAIGCPIRCLDEFDVFMDAVNRRIAMKMMIDTANASDSKQYILITPQDMSSVTFGPSVRVHRMNDPERGQTTLAS